MLSTPDRPMIYSSTRAVPEAAEVVETYQDILRATRAGRLPSRIIATTLEVASRPTPYLIHRPLVAKLTPYMIDGGMIDGAPTVKFSRANVEGRSKFDANVTVTLPGSDRHSEWTEGIFDIHHINRGTYLVGYTTRRTDPKRPLEISTPDSNEARRDINVMRGILDIIEPQPQAPVPPLQSNEQPLPVQTVANAFISATTQAWRSWGNLFDD